MTIEWTMEQINQLIEKSKDYKEKALLENVKTTLLEQEKRREQNQGELDGTLWSPREWNNP